MHIRRLRQAAGGLAIAAGLAVLVISGAGSASASGTQTAEDLTVPTSMTLSDLTPSIGFTPPVSLPGPTTVDQIGLNVVSNDPAGYTLTQTQTPLVDGTSVIPVTDEYFCFLDCSTSGNLGGFTPFSSAGTQLVVGTTSISAPTGDAYSPMYVWQVPNIVPGTYVGSMTYTVSAN